jgi:hypothetical protein
VASGRHQAAIRHWGSVMSSPIETFLSRLERVRHIGAGRWQACCPSHLDGTPSLSIKEESDGKVLIHCHAGCPAEQVVSAVGLDISDLYPKRDPRYEGFTPKRRSKLLTATQGLEICAKESLAISIIASAFASSRTLTESDRERLFLAVGRLCSVYAEVMR